MPAEFTQEMDGLISSQVIFIGATNRPFDLDDAVLRRLPCRVLIDLPDKAARQEILRILLREETLARDVVLDGLANMTDGFSGSDLKNLCLVAAFTAVKDSIILPWKTGFNKNTACALEPETEHEHEHEPPRYCESPCATSRILTNKHFSCAFTQVGPSSSDTQSSLSAMFEHDPQSSDPVLTSRLALWVEVTVAILRFRSTTHLVQELVFQGTVLVQERVACRVAQASVWDIP